jgi:hypothetical protein
MTASRQFKPWPRCLPRLPRHRCLALPAARAPRAGQDGTRRATATGSQRRLIVLPSRPPPRASSGLAREYTLMVAMSAPPKISDAAWATVLDGRAKRPPTSWRTLAAQVGVSHQALQARYRRHVEAQKERRAAERALAAAADPARPETLPGAMPERLSDPMRPRKPGEPITAVPVMVFDGEMDTESWMRAQGRSGYVMRTIVADTSGPSYKGNLRDDTQARALAAAERLREQRLADEEDFANGRFDPSSGRWMP